MRNGFEYVGGDRRTIPEKGFKALISDSGKFYSITVKWENGIVTEFRDSYKKLPMSVKKIAKSFNMDEGKGEIDYHAPRPKGYYPTPEEIDYLRRDVTIVTKAMREVMDEGMTKLTVASDSLAEYKRLTGSNTFQRIFPVFSEAMDAEIRRAYRGGFTIRDERFGGCITRSGLVLDVNSLYPFIMYTKLLPYGEPEFVKGKVIPTKERSLTIFSITFTAKLKPDHIACIQIKNSSFFAATEYLKEVKEPTTLMVTNVDWDLYQDHYDIDILAYGGGWRFKAERGMFDSYIEKWSEIKANSSGGKREIAKLHLNALYGKFASNPNITSKIPIMENDRVKLIRGNDETKQPIYTAVGVFITSWARDLTIRAAQDNYSTFAYADTDSLHLLQDEPPTNLEIHPTKLGAWKLEYKFDAAYYIRPKAYLERHHECICKPGDRQHADDAPCYTNRIAGLPEPVSSVLTFADLIDGTILHGKLNPKSVPGGVILKDVPFELKL